MLSARSHDPLVHVRTRMIGRLYSMLTSKPELERRILASLTNKLGDPEKKVCRWSRAARTPACAHAEGGICAFRWTSPPLNAVD